MLSAINRTARRTRKRRRGELRMWLHDAFPGVRFFRGRARDYLAAGINTDKEELSCVAMKTYRGEIFSSSNSSDHAQLRKWVNSFYAAPMLSYGWITNTGRYVLPGEAKKIALRANQHDLLQAMSKEGYVDEQLCY